ALYEAVLKKSPRNQGALARLAAVYEHEKKWPEARKQYARILDLDWTNLDAHLAIAGTYMAEENLDGAIGEFQKVVTKNPKHWDAWKALGRAQERKKDWDGALQTYARLAELAPKSAYPLASAAMVHLEKGEPAQALESSRKAVARDATLPEAHLALAKSLPEESAAEARKHYLEALRGAVARNNATRREASRRERASGLDPAWVMQAQATLAAGDRVGMEAVAGLRSTSTDEASRKEALEALEALSKEYPASTGLVVAIAGLHEDSGRHADSVPIYRRLVTEHPLDPQLRIQLASAYEKLGKRDEALAQYRRALELDGSNALAAEGIKRLEQPRIEVDPAATGWYKPATK
ncbi:MAG TPA: tetratricopeptide repeat protein, partial [Armatimonadota bacterium]|nr:tetratricopeptide repeat protein [Armatimonadota bacterium]